MLSLLSSAIENKIGSGLAASYGRISDLLHTDLAREDLGTNLRDLYLGQTSHGEIASAVDRESFFDLASLTKILATTTLSLDQYQSGKLSLNQSLSDFFPSATLHPSLKQITVRSLLAHQSGLPAWLPFYENLRAHFGARLPHVPLAERKAFLFQMLENVERVRDFESLTVYSDLGFLWLQRVLTELNPERDFEKAVRSLWSKIPDNQFYFQAVVESSAEFRNLLASSGRSVLATEVCPWRGLIQGQVHDDNAWSMGGIAGHAGVFGRLFDVKAWIKALLSEQFCSLPVLIKFTESQSSVPGPSRGLGFDHPSVDGSGSTGFSLSNQAFGHLGFTGTSLWVDPEQDLYAILLTNRVHPHRTDDRIRALRREFHAQVQGELKR